MVKHLALPYLPSDPREFEESIAIVAAGIQNPPQTQKELYIWLRALAGDGIPHKRVCSGHVTPWDLVWESYRVDLQGQENFRRFVIAVGPRDGQKTRSMAKLCTAELLLKPKCEMAYVAATDQQASRSTSYMKKFCAHPVISPYILKAIGRDISTKLNSNFEQLTGGMNSAQGLHPQKLRCDETELVRPREILEDMKLIPTSKFGIQKHQIYISTRKYLRGNMTWLITESKPSWAKVMVWCYKEITERCSDERSGTKPTMYEVPDLMKPGETLVVNAFDRCGECPLLPSCRGDLKRASGFMAIDDVIDSYHKLSREAWLVQKECVEPIQTDLFFQDWDTSKQTGTYPYNPKLPLDLSIDFSGGADDPTSVGFWQTDGENQYRIHEEIFRRKPSTYVADQVEQWCKDRGIRPRHMIGDSVNQQFMLDMRNRSEFFRQLKGTRKIDRKEGWMVCRRYVQDTAGVRHLFVDESCKNFISEVENANRSPRDPDDLIGDDHSLDDWRYYTVEFFHRNREPRVRFLDFSSMSRSEERSGTPSPEGPAADASLQAEKEYDISDVIARSMRDDD